MNPTYKDMVKGLRALGKYTPDKINLARTLTPAQKGAITKAYNKNKYLIENTKKFATTTVSKKTAKNLNTSAVKFDMPSGKVKIFVPIKPGEKLRISKGLAVIESRSDRRTIIPLKKDPFAQIDKIVSKLGRKEYLQFQVGDKTPIWRTFQRGDVEKMRGYLTDIINKSKNPDGLVTHMSILKINDPDLWGDDDDEEGY